MPQRQALPRRWLMTDERMGGALLAAVTRLPEDAGIVFRHHSLAAEARRHLFEKVRAAHSGLLLLGGSAELARTWGADGSHGRHSGATTAPAHDLAEIRAAEAAGAALVFLSPVFATRSHPDAPSLGPDGFAALARRTQLPVIALGGMNEKRAEGLADAYGWAGIDAWLPT